MPVNSGELALDKGDPRAEIWEENNLVGESGPRDMWQAGIFKR